MLLGIDISEREVAVILARPDGAAELALRASQSVVGDMNAAWLTIYGARGYALRFQASREIWDSAAADSMAQSLCDDYIGRLSQGIGTACALFNPVLGGELFSAIESKILGPLETRFPNYCLPVHARSTQLLAGKLGSAAAVLGAVALTI